MWTFDPTRGGVRPAHLVRLFEALGLATVFAVLPELRGFSAGHSPAPHPGWLAVLVLSARYGSTGFFAGLAAAAFGVAIASIAAGDGLATFRRLLDSESNLVALGACLVVSWIAASHARRRADLVERLTGQTERAARAEVNARALLEIAEALRIRVDRTSASLEFLRDVAGRIGGSDPVAAAEAAADLALVRTGAHAVAITAGEGDVQRLVAFRHAGESNGVEPPDPRTADVSLPIRFGTEMVGVLAVWGMDRSGADRASRHDLEIIASWCAAALAPTMQQQDAAEPRAVAVS